MTQHVAILATNLQRHHQANFVIDPKTGASLEYRNLVKGPTKAIWESSFAHEIGRLAQGVGTRMPSRVNPATCINGDWNYIVSHVVFGHESLSRSADGRKERKPEVNPAIIREVEIMAINGTFTLY